MPVLIMKTLKSITWIKSFDRQPFASSAPVFNQCFQYIVMLGPSSRLSLGILANNNEGARSLPKFLYRKFDINFFQNDVELTMLSGYE
jgi:hypothetical protein